MRVLVTGGTGFIGTNLVKELIRLGHEVSLFVRPSYNHTRVANFGKDLHDIYIADFTDYEAIIECVLECEPEWVFNLSSYGVHPNETDVTTTLSTNYWNVERLLQACVDVGSVKSFVHTGSCLEYGTVNEPTTEGHPLVANTVYGKSKALASKIVADMSIKHDFNAVTARLYAVYGPYEAKTRLIPKLIEYGSREQFPPLVSPDTARDFVYVDDVVNALILVAKSTNLPRGSAYNITSEAQTTIRELTGLVGNLMQFTAVPEWGSMPAKQWDTNVWVGDGSKIYDELDWYPKINLVNGLQKTIDWWKQQ